MSVIDSTIRSNNSLLTSHRTDGRGIGVRF